MGLDAETLQKLISSSYHPSNRGARESLAGSGFTLDDRYSTQQHKTVVDAAGKPYLIFTGSRRLIKDWLISDVALAAGYEKFTPRFAKSRGVLDDVSKAYGGQKVTVAGHSLGGSIASSVGSSNKVDKIITINKGVGLSSIFRPQSKKETAIRGATDIVSLGNLTQWNGKKITLPQTAFANIVKSHDFNLLTKLKKKDYIIV